MWTRGGGPLTADVQGYLRTRAESDAALNFLATKDGFLKTVNTLPPLDMPSK